MPDHFPVWKLVSHFQFFSVFFFFFSPVSTKHCKTLQFYRMKLRTCNPTNPTHPETRPRSHGKSMETGKVQLWGIYVVSLEATVKKTEILLKSTNTVMMCFLCIFRCCSQKYTSVLCISQLKCIKLQSCYSLTSTLIPRPCILDYL